ncbi:MAG: AarF/ABC1/UbiB kinase family protein [Deltaproteobacteria bacterium]|nr:MAG: AarF/ABC1/UbiB kinase family protein [Deltaproteobacteria bacterium]
MLSIRKIGVIGRTYRHLNRYRQILSVLFRYGFGDLIDTLRIDQYIEVGLQMVSRKKRDRLERLTRAERIRLAFEELGPTYIKLGQVLSTRPDLIPLEFVTELARLQDDVPPFDFAEARKIIEAELGAAPDMLFDTMEKKPVASASLGQVHLARIKDGDRVAVKVQRPGIRKAIEIDLEIMLHLATLMERHVEEISLHRPVKIVKEFADTLEKEIDYTIEAGSMERMARLFLNDPTVYIPAVYRELTTTRVLTMEFVNGIKISDTERLDREGFDKKRITVRGANLYLTQFFEHGFFHGDPHPGNIFVLPDHVICLLDFGMMGTIDRQTRELFVDLIDSVIHHQETRSVRVLLKLADWDEEPNLRMLEKDLAEFNGRHLYKPLKDIELGPLLHHLLELAARHRLRFPPNLFLMMKALATVEGVACALDPEFNLIAQATPFIEQIKLERMHPQRIADELSHLATDWYEFLSQFPQDLMEIIRQVRHRKLSFRHDFTGLDTMLDTYSQISNRISFSIVIAALIIGSALIVISEIPPLIFGISLIGIIGFFAAALMGIWLLFAIIRKGRL